MAAPWAIDVTGAVGFLVKGLIVGFVIAAPVGPIGVLCVRRTLLYGRLSGVITGLGAATADALYGCVAAFGLTVVSDVLIGHGTWLRLVGGVTLCLIGLKTLFAVPARESTAPRAGTLVGAFASTLLLTLTNPTTILSFAAVFAGLGLVGSSAGYLAASTLVGGVFLGSAAWWLGLSATVGLARDRIGPRALRGINRVSGALIAAFGVAFLVSAVVRAS